MLILFPSFVSIRPQDDSQQWDSCKPGWKTENSTYVCNQRKHIMSDAKYEFPLIPMNSIQFNNKNAETSLMGKDRRERYRHPQSDIELS